MTSIADAAKEMWAMLENLPQRMWEKFEEMSAMIGAWIEDKVDRAFAGDEGNRTWVG